MMNYAEAGLHGSGDDSDDVKRELHDDGSGGGEIVPKKAGRRKINIEFIDDKSRRHITFSKRKAGIMKKAYELSTLTGTQVLLLVASETGHVYTFATPKLQPLITKPEGKNLIQACLNAPEITPPSPPIPPHTSMSRPSQPHYDTAPACPSSSDAVYPAEHAPQTYEKDDGKEHRVVSRSSSAMASSPSHLPAEAGKSAFHIDVANHLGLAFGSPYNPSPSSPLNLGGMHPLSIGSMSYSPPGRYGTPASIPPHGHTPSVSSTAPPSNHGTSSSAPSWPPSVAGMMAQFPSPGFAPPTNPSYLWNHSSSSTSSSSSTHSSTSAHHASETPSKDRSHHEEGAGAPKEP